MIRTFLVLCFLSLVSTAAAAATRPNVVWFIVDDMSAHFSSYGEKLIETPHVDRLAREGTKFNRAFVTAPVCSPVRSAFITGMYQTTIGAHHHRSGRGAEKIHLPAGVKPLPVLFQQAGYHTCIGDGLPDTPAAGKGKRDREPNFNRTDYNFEWDASMYHGSDWADRKPGQPFFMQVQLQGAKLRGNNEQTAQSVLDRARAEFGSSTDPEKVMLPPYYPRDPVLLHDWAANLDSVRLTDKHVGDVIARLEKEGLLENTLVIFVTDHGISHARGKQFLYDEGTHVPFVVRGPGIAKGAVRNDLIELFDIAPISLAAAGIPIPAGMQAKNVFAPDYKPRDTVFSARDRCDETVDRMRSVRTDRFLYIRNFHPQRPMLQPNAYKDGKAILQRLRELHAAGKLDPLQEQVLFSPTRPTEELYEWTSDRWQVKNLAGNPAHRATLEKLRARLDRWMIETKDQGAEPQKMYDSDMAVYVKSRGKKGHDQSVTEKNIALMNRWAREGK